MYCHWNMCSTIVHKLIHGKHQYLQLREQSAEEVTFPDTSVCHAMDGPHGPRRVATDLWTIYGTADRPPIGPYGHLFWAGCAPPPPPAVTAQPTQ